MTITIHDAVEQGSDEWHALRCGMLTASNIKHIMTPTLKVASNDKTRQHVYEIAAQRITRYVEPQFISDDMLRGYRDEALARELYAARYERHVTQVGFITRDFGGFTIGYSPDGLVGDDGLIEIKSRLQKYQVQTISSCEMPAEYMLQVQCGLLVTGRDWCDFISYCGGLPMFVHRVRYDAEVCAAINDAAEAFEARVQEVMAEFARVVEVRELPPTERADEDAPLMDGEYV